ncbi:Rpn family recombination-promoting nuclease/putative transposase [Chlorogloea sp. CCALA 695]|uniref:Rpn family recombination-promoting nuclease/putative transposase n=1 Tax=Chlorogloea sp. CCALA 695 TaxID=2107693 RepID=UPI000D07BA3C|nr:Rpn family recombination-promoting nuclease/putative transposase [Chlorogloea sp. CCALA 695]PSB31696.1 hypothetical protein C7B70_12550 [Chlorogloea sp. CCALA 695]
MKTATLFYQLFQEFPSIFFELIGQPGTQANAYQFTSIELKQVAFRLDGLFLPSPDEPNLPIYFVEVQFQKDETFYYRLFAEIFLYLYQYKTINNWQAIVVYPKRSIESEPPLPYQFILGGDHVKRIYLDELGQNQSLGVGIIQLVVENEKIAATTAKSLIAKARQQLTDEQLQQQIIEFIETIVIYKFPSLSRQEVEAMLGLDLIRNTRVYQEAFTEGEQQGRLAAKLETVPSLIELGLSVEQIAQALAIDIEVVRQLLPKQP